MISFCLRPFARTLQPTFRRSSDQFPGIFLRAGHSATSARRKSKGTFNVSRNVECPLSVLLRSATEFRHSWRRPGVVSARRTWQETGRQGPLSCRKVGQNGQFFAEKSRNCIEIERKSPSSPLASRRSSRGNGRSRMDRQGKTCPRLRPGHSSAWPTWSATHTANQFSDRRGLSRSAWFRSSAGRGGIARSACRPCP
jgi:hypothetical protein